MYNGEKSLLGVRKYILEYIIQLDRVLTDLERARCIILGAKSQFYKDKIIVVGYCYNRKVISKRVKGCKDHLLEKL